MIALLLFLTLGDAPVVSISPDRPTVGDRITLRFPSDPSDRLRLEPSPGYEIVSVSGNTAVVRSFQPGEIVVRGDIRNAAGARTFDGVRITIASVLAADDKLEPAPLASPISPEESRTAVVAVGVAAIAAAIAWTALVILLRRQQVTGTVPITQSPAEEYRAVLERLSGAGGAALSIELADATRRYLARLNDRFSLDLTSRQLVTKLKTGQIMKAASPNVSQLLHAGDLAKFAPLGIGLKEPMTTSELLAEARSLIELSEPREDVA
ncbi:MAG TPA: hypothetical protein VNM92_15930 [Thermoanaerobaculia bacterium]|nr:hypothetical protein [Thermoanaerobaculia bacterium]